MGFLKNAIRRGISEGVGKVVSDTLSKVVEPAATEFANKTAEHFNQAAPNQAQPATRQTGTFEEAFNNLQRSVESYTTETAKNIKICPKCENACTADKKFCPSCGTQLPEQTVAEGAVCTKCGKQNSVGVKFCSDCGEKLPCAVQEEQAAAARADAVMAEWETKLPEYPKWSCGGTDPNIEEYDVGIFMFAASFEGNHIAAKAAVEKYRQLALQNGFRQAGEYPNIEHLYKKINGSCYHIDTEHCFDGDSDCPCIYFNIAEPTGGFDYVKPEPKKPSSFLDLFK